MDVEGRGTFGSKTFTGIIQRWDFMGTIGFITPDDPGSLPKHVRTALAKDAAAGGRLGFFKTDVNYDDDVGLELAVGVAVTFQVWADKFWRHGRFHPNSGDIGFRAFDVSAVGMQVDVPHATGGLSAAAAADPLTSSEDDAEDCLGR